MTRIPDDKLEGSSCIRRAHCTLYGLTGCPLVSLEDGVIELAGYLEGCGAFTRRTPDAPASTEKETQASPQPSAPPAPIAAPAPRFGIVRSERHPEISIRVPMNPPGPCTKNIPFSSTVLKTGGSKMNTSTISGPTAPDTQKERK